MFEDKYFGVIIKLWTIYFQKLLLLTMKKIYRISQTFRGDYKINSFTFAIKFAIIRVFYNLLGLKTFLFHIVVNRFPMKEDLGIWFL